MIVRIDTDAVAELAEMTAARRAQGGLINGVFVGRVVDTTEYRATFREGVDFGDTGRWIYTATRVGPDAPAEGPPIRRDR